MAGGVIGEWWGEFRMVDGAEDDNHGVDVHHQPELTGRTHHDATAPGNGRNWWERRSRERQTCHMTASDPKADLHLYLQSARDALLWKLEGLSEYDIRRPLTPTGTNLLGLVKHVASVELGYLGDESRKHIVELYRRAWAHADATIDALALDTIGRVPWWPSGGDEVTLHHAVVRVIADTHRHAGHADIIRELIDGAVGMNKSNDSMAPGDSAWWENYRSRLERAAQEADRDT